MKKIAIIGAAGYLGLEIIRQIKFLKCEVIAITRRNGNFLLPELDPNIIIKNQDDLDSIGKVDVVINLAYPTSGLTHHYIQKNNEIFNIISKISSSKTKLIHVSSLAVFGFQLDRNILNDRVKYSRDYPYIEAKIHLENLILNKFTNDSIVILRLGNIWGPGSTTWTVPLINKILFYQPVGIFNENGYCNATDVVNAASLIIHIIQHVFIDKPLFYHLAEFSSIKWDYWIKKIEKSINHNACYEPFVDNLSSNLIDDSKILLSNLSIGSIYRRIATMRFAGSYSRNFLSLIGDNNFYTVKAKYNIKKQFNQELNFSDKLFLNILSCKTEFKSIYPLDWAPPINSEESWGNVEDWMRNVGYIE